MMKFLIKLLSILLIFYGSCSYGQMEKYKFKRELKGVTEHWHKINMPNEVFGKISQDFADLRIFGITASNDTLEVPYILKLSTEKTEKKEVVFKTINSSQNDKSYYFTFEIPSTETINEIQLDFKQKNFDWRIKLEGSQDQKDWVKILENYRILAIQNEITSFQFTKLNFPSSQYRYLRLSIEAKEKPELTSATIALDQKLDGTFKNYKVKKIEKKENVETKETEIDIDLSLPSPVSYIKLYVRESLDYYRPITIKHLIDSTKTEQGWKYHYATLTTGILHSLGKNEFKFNSTTAQKLKILIHNQDNQALSIDSINVKGYEHELIARFTEKATYFLVYGYKEATRPNYDIGHFIENIPLNISTLNIGNESTIGKYKVLEPNPLFKNKAWLWGIIVLIILVIGWFTIKMMKQN